MLKKKLLLRVVYLLLVFSHRVFAVFDFLIASAIVTTHVIDFLFFIFCFITN